MKKSMNRSEAKRVKIKVVVLKVALSSLLALLFTIALGMPASLAAGSDAASAQSESGAAGITGGRWTDEGSYDTSWFEDETNREQTSFTLTTAEQLAGLARLVNYQGYDFSGMTISLGADIDLSDHNWTPIASTYRFQGTFDGNNYEITNMNIDIGVSGESVVAGFFGNIENAVIVNVRIGGGSSVAVSVDNWQLQSPYIGGIVGDARRSTIRNCRSEAVIEVDAYNAFVGGIVGYSESVVEGCCNKGDVTTRGTRAFAGGIIGYGGFENPTRCCRNTGNISATGSEFSQAGGITAANGGPVNDCNNSGSVTAGGGTAAAGGIAGQIIEPIIRCYNTGAITACGSTSNEAGGIAGNSSHSSTVMEYCYNSGNVTAKDGDGGLAGGLLGRNGGSVQYCTNSGNVLSENGTGLSSGGIAGNNYGGKISCCINKGAIGLSYGQEVYSGGIVGDNLGMIKDCINDGAVSACNIAGRNMVGGIAGSNSLQLDWYPDPGIIRNCYNAGSVLADTAQRNEAGGIVGVNVSIIYNCYSTGSVTGKNAPSFNYVAGVAGGNGQLLDTDNTPLFTGTIENSYWLSSSASKLVDASCPGFTTVSCGAFNEDGIIKPVKGNTIAGSNKELIDALNAGRDDDDMRWETGSDNGWPVQLVIISSVSINGELTVYTNSDIQLSAAVSPVNAADTAVIWSVFDGTGSAAIDSSGSLTGITPGTVTVRATAVGAGAAYTETVVTVLPGITDAPAATEAIDDPALNAITDVPGVSGINLFVLFSAGAGAVFLLIAVFLLERRGKKSDPGHAERTKE